MSSASATGSSVSGSFHPWCVAKKPSAEVMRKASVSFAR